MWLTIPSGAVPPFWGMHAPAFLIETEGRDCRGVLNMMRSLWQVLLEDPSQLTCDECFAVLEYYSDLLTQRGAGILPKVMEHLQGCPECRIEHQEALRRLEITHHKKTRMEQVHGNHSSKR
jgi:hypothetical protein